MEFGTTDDTLVYLDFFFSHGDKFDLSISLSLSSFNPV